MEKSMVTHRLSLDMSSQAVQATITLAQWDQATHRLIVTLRHGAEVVELPPGSYSVAVQNSEAGVDVLDTVTVYGADSVHPNCIVYDVSPAITEKEGYHEGQFLISCVDENGSLQTLASPRIAFVVKPDIMRSSDVQNSEPYAAVVAAKAAAEKAKDEAVLAKDAAEAVGVIDAVSVTDEDKLLFTFKDGRQVETDSGVRGPAGVGTPGADGVSPTVEIEDIDGGHRVTVTDANGPHSFDVMDGEGGAGEQALDRDTLVALIGEATEDSSGLQSATDKAFTNEIRDLVEIGGITPSTSDPSLKTTTLFNGYLGVLKAYEYIFDGDLSDEIRPNTKYIVNGKVYDSGDSATIETSQDIAYDTETGGSSYLRYSLLLSENHISLIADNNEGSAGEYVIPVKIKVIGLASFTAIANSISTYPGMDAEFEALQLPSGKALTLYLHCGDIVRPYIVDETGYLAPTTRDTRNYGFIVSVTNWVLEVKSAGNQRLTQYMITIENQDAMQSAGSEGGGGGSLVVYMGYYSHYTFEFNYAKTYLIKLSSGSTTNYYAIRQGDMVSLSITDDTDYNSVYIEGSYLEVYTYSSYGSVLEITEIGTFENIYCFIAGTEVLLRDPETMEIYTKRIEDVLPFEYAAYWSPEKGRLTATRVLAPPIVGDCTEYDRLTFSDGTVLNVFGVQFFWNVDTDRLQNWADMVPGTRVCTSEGDIVEYVGSEHIVSETPVKHVTLLTFMGRYMAGGIQVGDKRELILPRLLQPERIKYYRMLPQKDRDNLKRACDSGMKRRNRRFSREYVEAKHGFAERRRALKEEQTAAERYLTDTDYQVIKLTEGVLSEEEFAPTRTMRADKRVLVNRCRTDAVALDAEEKETLASVEQQILDTYVPKRAGKFAGKTRAVLEEEAK